MTKGNTKKGNQGSDCAYIFKMCYYSKGDAPTNVRMSSRILYAHLGSTGVNWSEGKTCILLIVKTLLGFHIGL